MCVGATLSFVPSPAPVAALASPAVTRVEQQAPDRWVVDGSLFGADSLIASGVAPTSLNFELPSGLRALRLLGTMNTRDRLAGSVDDGLVFSVTGQPITQLPFRAGSFSLDLAAANDATVDPTMTVETQTVTTDPCRDAPTVPLSDLAIVAVGKPVPPKSFADFFPSVMDRLVIRVAAADVDEPGTAQGVIDLVSFASHRWPAAHVVVTNQDLAVSPFDRKVEFRRSAKRPIGLETNDAGTTLVIGGPSVETPGLVAFIASPQFGASFLSQVEAGALPRVAARSEIAQPFVVLSDLRPSAVAVGQGEATVSVELDQVRFGGQMASITATVNGVARSTGAAAVTVQLRANNRILATKRVGNDEAFELTGSLSAPSLAAENVFEVRASDLGASSQSAAVQVAPTSGGCPTGVKLPTVTVELDPTSSFEGTPGVGVSSGFDRFPQAFASGFDVRLDRRGMSELVGAATVVELLQQQSPTPLRARITQNQLSVIEQFDRPTLFVSSRGTTVGANGSLASSPAGQQAELRAVAGMNADHLLLIAKDDSGIGRLLSQTTADRRGLRTLRGDLLIENDGVVKNLRLNTDENKVVVRRVLTSQSRVRYPMWSGFVIGGLIAILVVISRHRRAHS